MTIYTGYGDDGSTRGFDGQDVAKDDPRMEAVGSVDELNSHLGLCLCLARETSADPVAKSLDPLQSELFALGAALVSAGTHQPLPLEIESGAVDRMEADIDRAWQRAGKLDHFILPGGSMLSAQLHVTRSVCRRAERNCVQLGRQVKLEPLALKYLNRLSDLLFALARLANALGGCREVTWQRPQDPKA